ncbi:unnamed protein product [Pipistrellus nathusii]|uniref:Interleukin-8 n=1 Tax=Pipistrellus nathusii TaxID=59473 RepID=A0ABN9Z416_PIPNA
MTSKLAVALLATILLSASLHAASFLFYVECQCIGTHSEPFHPKYIKEMKIIWTRPQCDHMEIIAKLENGLKICLNPEAKWVQKVVSVFLEK